MRLNETTEGKVKSVFLCESFLMMRRKCEDEDSAIPLALLCRQLSCGLQVFVDEFFLCGWQAGLISAVLHGVLSFPLNKQGHAVSNSNALLYKPHLISRRNFPYLGA